MNGWAIGFTIGGVIVVVVVILVVTIILQARSIANDAANIDAALSDAVRNTAALAELNSTVAGAEVIVDGLRRGRIRLGG